MEDGKVFCYHCDASGPRRGTADQSANAWNAFSKLKTENERLRKELQESRDLLELERSVVENLLGEIYPG
jgi:hypothetical protein